MTGKAVCFVCVEHLIARICQGADTFPEPVRDLNALFEKHLNLTMKRLLTPLLVVVSLALHAQIDPVNKNQVAIDGYDVVAYFRAGKATKGDPRYQSQHESVTYHFVNAENKELFDKDPSKYVPQYGGYCALAVSYGQKISVNPETFKVVDDKLYLFFNGHTRRGQVNSLETWNKNEPRLLEKADRLWPDVKKKKYNSKETL